METIGIRIMQIRKQKGMSQEALSDLAGINLRTLQRIEKDETTPHGNTLLMLCKALEIQPEEIISYGKTEDREFLTWFHLSPIIGLIIPLGQLLLPFILWITKRDQIKDLNQQGANVVNFQIWWLIVFYSFIFISVGINPGMFLPYLILFSIVNILYPALIAYRITKGAPIRPFYPWFIRIIK